MIGEPINRLDGRLKVTGGATYSAEWPTDRLLYGVIIQSTIAKGTIASIDTVSSRHRRARCARPESCRPGHREQQRLMPAQTRTTRGREP